MARFVRPLNETKIKSLKFSLDGKNEHADGKGLYLFLFNGDRKVFYFIYSHPTTKKRIKRKIGDYGVLSLNEAREKINEYHRLLLDGLEPFTYLEQLAKEQARRAITVREYAEEWRKLKLINQDNKPITMDREWGRLELYLFPHFGDYPLSAVKMDEVARHFEPLYVTKPNTATKVIGRFIDILQYAVADGLIEFNPLAGIRKTRFKKVKAQHNPTINAEELPQLFQRLNLSNSAVTVRLLIEWQILTMLRPFEAVAVEWADVDFEKQILTIPAERMKGTQKKARSHTVPLSRQALAVLEEMKKHNGNKKHIFASTRSQSGVMSSQTVNHTIKHLGYKGILTAHGLRAMARTYLADVGVDFQVAESCLAHVVGNDVSQSYNHSSYLALRKEVMQKWGDYVEQCKKR
ncbi:hypothetical protein B0187_06270 [Haemophilus paracuniculus]|uniref:Tyr recombinase domain-containing protein n=1 Tax=Haemophilus paracuniculus TaxID=734 RepID=A0A1T0ARG3_9PAST|nr:tyrosine-type recombinase/integrase [Haemophilus paracuniculus]OOR98864.1 hypothetical protein B0187_06270 [Haemophilus paracuniculus]